MKKEIIILIFCLFLTNANAQEISINSGEFEINETFKIEVSIDTLNETIGASFNLNFNNKIKALKVEEGSFMKKCSATTFGSIPPAIEESKIKFRDLCFSEPLNGKGTLAVITFKALTPGKTDLELSDANIFNINGDPVSGVKTKNGVVNVNGGENEIIQNKAGENKTSEPEEKEIEAKEILKNESVKVAGNKTDTVIQEIERQNETNPNKIINDDKTTPAVETGDLKTYDTATNKTKENTPPKTGQKNLLIYGAIIVMIIITVIVFKKYKR